MGLFIGTIAVTIIIVIFGELIPKVFATSHPEWFAFSVRHLISLIIWVMGPVTHAEKWFLPYSDTFLPVWSLWAVGVTIPFVELLGGGLVLVGLWRRPALVALGCVLLVVTFGHLLKEPLYAFHEHVVPRLALLLFVLALPPEADRFSLDGLLRSRRKGA